MAALHCKVGEQLYYIYWSYGDKCYKIAKGTVLAIRSVRNPDPISVTKKCTVYFLGDGDGGGYSCVRNWMLFRDKILAEEKIAKMQENYRKKHGGA